MARIRSRLVKTLSNCTAYRDQPPGFAPDPITLEQGTTLHATIEVEEAELDGTLAPAVYFTVGQTWFWMPHTEFDLYTEPFDVLT